MTLAVAKEARELEVHDRAVCKGKFLAIVASNNRAQLSIQRV